MRSPPFEITTKTLSLVADIMRILGSYDALSKPMPQPQLRRKSRVRTLHGSLGIEGNTLTMAQITAVLDGKRIIGPKKDILEVQNAVQAYEKVDSWSPSSTRHFLQAHRVLMRGILPDAGKFRTGGVGIFKGKNAVHVAPPANRVEALVRKLFSFYRKAEVHFVICSSVLHYELAFIHPFSDGNGRIARLWQHVALARQEPLFRWVPLESIIHEQREAYYHVLRESDQRGASTPFIEFLAGALLEALKDVFADVRPTTQRAPDRLMQARTELGSTWFSRKDYMQIHRQISTATASRDLERGVKQGWIAKRGNQARTQYCFQQ